MRELKEFRDTLRSKTEQTEAPSLETILARRQPESGLRRAVPARWAWAMAFAVALGLGIVPLVEFERAREAEARRVKQEQQDREDARLMQQVNEALSRGVPRAMAPLWEGGR